jgi:hypothetical protein
MKTILKLAVFGLLVYACVNIAYAWMQYFEFKDGVRQASQTGFSLSDDELHNRVLEIAEQNSIPLAQDGFSVRRDDKIHTLIDGSYTKEISLLPIRAFPWTFTFHTDTMSVTPPKLH